MVRLRVLNYTLHAERLRKQFGMDPKKVDVFLEKADAVVAAPVSQAEEINRHYQWNFKATAERLVYVSEFAREVSGYRHSRYKNPEVVEEMAREGKIPYDFKKSKNLQRAIADLDPFSPWIKPEVLDDIVLLFNTAEMCNLTEQAAVENVSVECEFHRLLVNFYAKKLLETDHPIVRKVGYAFGSNEEEEKIDKNYLAKIYRRRLCHELDPLIRDYFPIEVLRNEQQPPENRVPNAELILGGVAPQTPPRGTQLKYGT